MFLSVPIPEAALQVVFLPLLRGVCVQTAPAAGRRHCRLSMAPPCPDQKAKVIQRRARPISHWFRAEIAPPLDIAGGRKRRIWRRRSAQAASGPPSVFAVQGLKCCGCIERRQCTGRKLRAEQGEEETRNGAASCPTPPAWRLQSAHPELDPSLDRGAEHDGLSGPPLPRSGRAQSRCPAARGPRAGIRSGISGPALRPALDASVALDPEDALRRVSAGSSQRPGTRLPAFALACDERAFPDGCRKCAIAKEGHAARCTSLSIPARHVSTGPLAIGRRKPFRSRHGDC